MARRSLGIRMLPIQPMILVGEVKVFKHPKANTLYLSIPAKMASDEEFTIKDGDTLIIEFKKDNKELVIKRKP